MYSMTMSDTCATHVFGQGQVRKLFGQGRLRNMQVSLCWWLVNCCVKACKQTQRDTQGRKRAKCAHVGDTNNSRRGVAPAERHGRLPTGPPHPFLSCNGHGCRRRELSYDTASAMQNSLMLPRMLLHRPPGSGHISRNKLSSRFEALSRGEWIRLFEACIVCDAQTALTQIGRVA